MATDEDHNTDLRLKGNLSFIYVASLLIVILIATASAAGLRYRTLVYPTNELVRTFVPNDVVSLSIGLPILIGSVWLARRGRLIGLLCWTGALFFVFYNSIAYVFAVPPGWLFLLQLTLVVLSVYTLIALLTVIDTNVIQQRLTGAVPERLAGGVLAGLGLLFFLRVVNVIVSTPADEVLLSRTELAVSVSDFLIAPAWVIGGILLWRRKPFGYLSGLGLLFQGSMLFIALITFLLLQPVLIDAPLAVMDVVVIAVMGLICFIPFALFVRGVTAKQTGDGMNTPQ